MEALLTHFRAPWCLIVGCMQDTFARARTRPGQARAKIGNIVYKLLWDGIRIDQRCRDPLKFKQIYWT